MIQKIKAVDRQVMLIYVYSLTLSSLFILPVILPYYRDVIGIGFREFLIAEAVFSAVVILGEVPSGYLSDIWKRKTVLALGVATQLVGYSILFIADGLALVILSQGIIGAGLSLTSGTCQALLYDSLLEKGRENEFRNLEGKRHGLGLYALAFACVIGGFLYQINPYAPLIADIIAITIALIAVLLMKEPQRHKADIRHSPFRDIWETAKYALHGHKEIAGIILFSAILFAGSKIVMWSQQPYYMALELPEAWFGILIASGALLGGLGGQFGHRLEHIFRNKSLLVTAMAVMVAAMVLAGAVIGYHGIALLMLGSLIYGICGPSVQDAINSRIPSDRRATVLSTASLMVHLTFIPLSLGIGKISDSAGIGAALIMLGLIVGSLSSVFLLALWRNGRKGKRKDAGRFTLL